MKVIFSLALSLTMAIAGNGWTQVAAEELPPGVTPRTEPTPWERRQGGAALPGASAELDAPQDGWQQWVEDYFARSLKDPYSAVKRQTSDPFRGNFAVGWSRRDSWAVCYSVNAKNSYGAYTGERYYLFLLTSAGGVYRVLPSGTKLSRTASAFEELTAENECASRPPPKPRATPENPKIPL